LASDAVPKVALPLLRTLGTFVPKLRPAGIDTTKISKDPGVVAAYQADPLVHHGKPTLGLSLGLFSQFDVLPERARALTIPLLLQHGGKDVLAEPAGSRLLESTSGSPDQTVRWYPELWHEIYNEPERAQPLADLREWLAAHR
jgi:acylglycerol lipase